MIARLPKGGKGVGFGRIGVVHIQIFMVFLTEYTNFPQ